MKLSWMLAESAKTHRTGCMVCLAVPRAVAMELALPGGEPVEDLHITLAYMGKDLDRILIRKLEGVCAMCAAMHPSLHGRVVSIGRFPPSKHSDGKEVVIAKPVINGLLHFRDDLVKRLNAVGGSVRENFEYTPHITLAYVRPGAFRSVAVPQVALKFRELTLVCSSVRKSFPFAV